MLPVKCTWYFLASGYDRTFLTMNSSKLEVMIDLKFRDMYVVSYEPGKLAQEPVRKGHVVDVFQDL
ncbi:MAG: hypothetical protein MZV63_21165 [Marinilabiliales bacterium]|nr:hypothetical protein [Marinilabiliales bacterium]